MVIDTVKVPTPIVNMMGATPSNALSSNLVVMFVSVAILGICVNGYGGTLVDNHGYAKHADMQAGIKGSDSSTFGLESHPLSLIRSTSPSSTMRGRADAVCICWWGAFIRVIR